MKVKNELDNLPENFTQEKQILTSLGINSWFKLMKLTDDEINQITQTALATLKNLKRLRCIAILIYELEIPQGEAALLMHSGVASSKALSLIHI